MALLGTTDIKISSKDKLRTCYPNDQARARINDTGQRKIIEWISKSWNEHELKLPVFYRETLGRLLCLERFRNLIETNISAGIALYTDHQRYLCETPEKTQKKNRCGSQELDHEQNVVVGGVDHHILTATRIKQVVTIMNIYFHL